MKLEGKTRLISFGCSFTAGSELIDHEVLGISFDECNKMKHQWIADRKPMHKFEDYVSRAGKMTLEEYINFSSKRSYAAKLADKLGLEHVNYAIPGSAVDHMVLDLFRGHYTKKLNPETDLIFLGMTTPHRYLSFSPEKTGVPVSRVMSDRDFEDSDMHYNDYKVMQTYLFALQNFKNFCIVNNFYFYMQPSFPKELLFYNDPKSRHGNMFADMYVDWQYLPTFKEIFQGILDYSIDPAISLFTAYNNQMHDLVTPPLCGFKHPPEIAHVLFAEALYDKIINTKN
jgi:hypothetical protein